MDQKVISNQVIDTVRERSDLLAIASESISLKKTGQNYTGLCPFHDEKTASFVINPVKQFFHCFGCGAGGDVFHFIEKLEGTSFPEALRSLAEREGIPLSSTQAPKSPGNNSETEEIYRLNQSAAAYFHNNLLNRPEGAVALAYLKGRGVSIDTMKAFSLGYAMPSWNHLLKTFEKKFRPAILERSGLISRKSVTAGKSQSSHAYLDRFRNRILFPIHTSHGKVAGFGGRVLDNAIPKYLNTSETPVFKKGKILFGLHRAKSIANQPLIIVEGYLDAITAFQAGIPNVVATLGTALTEAHIRLIRRFPKKITLIFDGDDAGIKAALRTAPLLIDPHLSAHIVSLPSGKDPDIFIREHGRDAFIHEIEQSKTVIDFSISQYLNKSALQSVGDKMEVIDQIVPLIKRLRSNIERSHYLKSLAESMSLREEDVRSEYFRQTKKERMATPRGVQALKVQKELEPPDEQKKILMHLIQGCLDPMTLNGKLTLKDFTHPTLRKAIAVYWNSEEELWSGHLSNIATRDESCQSLLSRLSTAEISSEHAKEDEDCIRVLRKKRIDRERSKIELQLKQIGSKGDLEVVHTLQKKILDLKKESSHLILSC